MTPVPGHTCQTDHKRLCIVGICPACGEEVLWDADPVWTCPADLAELNPYRRPSNPRITDEMMEEAGIYSNCGENFGLACYDRVPLHGTCYDEVPLDKEQTDVVQLAAQRLRRRRQKGEVKWANRTIGPRKSG